MDSAALSYAAHGAQLFQGVVVDVLPRLTTILSPLAAPQAGVRISGLEGLGWFVEAGGPIGALAQGVLGPGTRPVRALLFDKTPGTNWALAWYQDRTISVRGRVETQGFGPWTIKAGMPHVAPPFDLLARMVTLRVHLDDVPAGNAPLLIAPGSHCFGRVPVDAIQDVVAACGTHACLARAGDVWLYATPILHASDAAAQPAHRRVLQIDYAAEELPGELDWSGV